MGVTMIEYVTSFAPFWTPYHTSVIATHRFCRLASPTQVKTRRGDDVIVTRTDWDAEGIYQYFVDDRMLHYGWNQVVPDDANCVHAIEVWKWDDLKIGHVLVSRQELPGRPDWARPRTPSTLSGE